MIYLDTHVAIFLAGKQSHKLPKKLFPVLDNEDIILSSISLLELKFLYQIGRLKLDSEAIFAFLSQVVGVRLSTTPLDSLIFASLDLAWTRDIFDRLIVADCIANGAKLITKDTIILENYSGAIWD